MEKNNAVGITEGDPKILFGRRPATDAPNASPPNPPRHRNAQIKPHVTIRSYILDPQPRIFHKPRGRPDGSDFSARGEGFYSYEVTPSTWASERITWMPHRKLSRAPSHIY